MAKVNVMTMFLAYNTNDKEIYQFSAPCQHGMTPIERLSSTYVQKNLCGLEEQFATVCDMLALEWSIESTKDAVGAEVRRNNERKSLRDKLNASWVAFVGDQSSAVPYAKCMSDGISIMWNGQIISVKGLPEGISLHDPNDYSSLERRRLLEEDVHIRFVHEQAENYD